MSTAIVPFWIYGFLALFGVSACGMSYLLIEDSRFTRENFAYLGQAMTRPLRMLAEGAAHKKSGLASLRREIAEVYRQVKRDRSLMLNDLGRGVHGMRPGADCLACLGAGTLSPCICPSECGSTNCARRSA